MKQQNYQALYQFTAFWPIFPINAYVWEEAQSLTVIDIGLKAFVKPIMKLSKSLKKPVQMIVLTHPHIDHLAGLDALKQEFPEAKFALSKRDAKLLANDFSLEIGEAAEQIKGGFKSIAAQPDILLADGDKIGSLTVLSSPGHTPGSISLYHATSQILIVGDALQTQAGLAISGDKRFFFPFPAQATWSKQTALESAKKLAQLEISCLATGHGNLLFQPDLHSAISRLESKLKYEKEN